MVGYNLKELLAYTLTASEINASVLNSNVKNYSFDSKKGAIDCKINPKNFDLATFYKHLRNWAYKINVNVNVDLESFFKIIDPKLHEDFYTCVISALSLSQKNLYTLKTITKKNDLNFNIMISDLKLKNFSQTSAIIEGENFARKLQLMPANILTAEKFVEEVKLFLQPIKNLVEILVIDKKEMLAKKMNLLLAVNSGSSTQPYLLCIKYLANKGGKIKSYIGKGILFDTGGINLKPSNYMSGMQYDMSGAAIVAGAIYAIAKNNIKTNIVAIMPLTENSISSNATRPSDVVISYNNMSVEIDNTDAEGRLILADAITYAIKDQHVDEILTIATLTGAAVIALGEAYTPIFTTGDNEWNLVKSAAMKVGEDVWRMPFNFEFEKRLYSSKIADIVNSDKIRDAGSSMGAEFLKAFVEKKNFIHMDIAGSSECQHQPLPIMLRTLYEMSKNEK